MTAYYNEFDSYAAAWLRNLISAGLIAPGDVDERSIVDVRPTDLKGYTQCHFFAGIGGWSYAARLAGWPDDRELWTGSCPCQGESVAGKRLGKEDPRHLWPKWFPLIEACRPVVVMGEQVARAAGTHWLDGVHTDLESIGYTARAAIVPACAVDAPHRRDRLWFVADTNTSERWSNMAGGDDPDGQETRRQQGYSDTAERGESSLADAHSGTVRNEPGWSSRANRTSSRIDSDDGQATLADTDSGHSFWWSGPLQVGWNSIAGQVTPGGDAPATQWRIKPGLPLLANGVSARVGKLSAFGNAIVPQVAAEIIGAYLDAEEASAVRA